MRVDDLLRRVLSATADKTRAEARISHLRELLGAEARRRHAEEGAAPSWKARGLGSVRLDGADAPLAPYVVDGDEVASYVAQQQPGEVTASITVDSTELEAALEALGFAGIVPRGSRVEVRPAYLDVWLKGLDPIDPDTVADPSTGAVVPGVRALRPASKLVVALDRDARAAVLDEVAAELEAEEEQLAAELTAQADPQAAADVGEALVDELRAVATAATAAREADAVDRALTAEDASDLPHANASTEPTRRDQLNALTKTVLERRATDLGILKARDRRKRDLVDLIVEAEQGRMSA